MGKLYLGNIEIANNNSMMSMSGTVNTHTADTEIHVTEMLLSRISTLEEKMQKAQAREISEYEIVGSPTIPAEIKGDVASFDITVNYKRTDTHYDWSETVTTGTDIVTVECGQNPSTSSTRTVSGTVDYHGNEIEYSVTQSKMVYKVICKFNITDTSNQTKIANSVTNFENVEIDGVEQSSVVSAYTFSTTGEHTVIYTLATPTSIGDSAFYGCYNLTSVTIPISVTSINDSAFQQCSGLTSVEIPSGATTIGQGSFAECYSLTSITIPDSVTTIGNSAFAWCISLTNVTIPSGITNIGESVFSACTSLTSVTIPNNVTSIGSNGFNGCTSLSSITIGSGVTTIGILAFSQCTNLKSITIPSGVTSIGAYAFANCTSITSITSDATTAPTIANSTFRNIKTEGTLFVPSGSSGYDVWMGKGNYYLGLYNWTKVEQ